MIAFVGGSVEAFESKDGIAMVKGSGKLEDALGPENGVNPEMISAPETAKR